MALSDVTSQLAESKAPSGNLPAPDQVGGSENFKRNLYDPWYFSLGAKPTFLSSSMLRGMPIVKSGLLQTLMLTKHARSKGASAHAKQVSGIMQKLLTRGSLPYCTLKVEAEIANDKQLAGSLRQHGENHDEIGWKWHGRWPEDIADQVASACLRRSVIAEETLKYLESGGYEGMFGSRNEADFLCNWVAKNLGAKAIHWFWPQASLDTLLQDTGFVSSGSRRLDCLFFHPQGQPLAIEFAEFKHDDEVYSKLLAVGISTVRIPVKELKRGDGENLNLIKMHAQHALQLDKDVPDSSGVCRALVGATDAARLQFALAKGIENGQLDLLQRKWKVSVVSQRSRNAIIEAAASDFQDLLWALNTLFGETPTAPSIEIVQGNADRGAVDFSIGIYSDESPLTVEHVAAGEDIIFCSAAVPVILANSIQHGFERSKVNDINLNEAESALTVILQTLFRKRKFREYQCVALLNVLRGKDTIALLPTGAGKSLIYQLSGLLMPGVTLVIDPSVALIDDQIDGLDNVGIDRAIGITGHFDLSAQQRLHSCIANGMCHFLFATPERMHMSQFRESLRILREKHVVSLAVIDEAHCVSEWGHNFRPSYLMLSSSLRKHCMSPDGKPPILLALTGTASRAVLRELLQHLEINIGDTGSIVRPRTFDRPELHFHISRVESRDHRKYVIGRYLKLLPGEFGMEPDAFYKPAGAATLSGIVFTLYVNSSYCGPGINEVSDIVESAIDVTPATYSDKSPGSHHKYPDGWEAQKRLNAKAFKDNQIPVMVATKAFGMGIDKSNIRWSIHASMPRSLEAFYQEAGRVGRDRKSAICCMLFKEGDPRETDRAFTSVPELDFEELRSLYHKRLKLNCDDISGALFFHLLDFGWKSQEMKAIELILDETGNFAQQGRFIIPFGQPVEVSERAIMRLVKSGLVDDYTVDNERKCYEIIAREFNFAHSRSIIAKYIAESQPGLLKELNSRLGYMENLPTEQLPYLLTRFVVDFTYREIELSRRRMLYEIILLCRRHSDDVAIRKALFAYLQGEQDAERIEKLAQNENVDFDDWLYQLGEIHTPKDAIRMRGEAISVLAAYPSHPGLLVMRSVAEAMATDTEEMHVRNTLLLAFHNARERYALSTNELMQLCAMLLDYATLKAPQLRIPLISALLEHQERTSEFDQRIFSRLHEASLSWDFPSQSVLQAAICEQKLATALTTLETGVKRYNALSYYLLEITNV